VIAERGKEGIMRLRFRALVALLVLVLVLGATADLSAAGLTGWTNFGFGWANAGYAVGDDYGIRNGDGNHTGHLWIASSTELGPRRIRLRVVSRDSRPVEVGIWYLWIGCRTPDGTYWRRDLSGVFPDFTPPASFVIYNARIDGPVEACHVSVELSTDLYSDGLHHFEARLQARYLGMSPTAATTADPLTGVQ
jgi:hypothetical protein